MYVLGICGPRIEFDGWPFDQGFHHYVFAIQNNRNRIDRSLNFGKASELPSIQGLDKLFALNG